MSWNHQATKEEGGQVTITLNNYPDECPQCHHKGTFTPVVLFLNRTKFNSNRVEVVFRCSNSKCYEVFLGYYRETANRTNTYVINHLKPEEHTKKDFSGMIMGISDDFSVIYNQALSAENSDLDQVCGPGYRKALEFLIKDYLIQKTSAESEHEKIKKEALGVCISDRIEDRSIKEVAKRAVWLGNDETHYVRKWGEKDLQDLKNLIDLTIHWMEAEALTATLLKDMPKGGSLKTEDNPSVKEAKK